MYRPELLNVVKKLENSHYQRWNDLGAGTAEVTDSWGVNFSKYYLKLIIQTTPVSRREFLIILFLIQLVKQKLMTMNNHKGIGALKVRSALHDDQQQPNQHLENIVWDFRN